MCGPISFRHFAFIYYPFLITVSNAALAAPAISSSVCAIKGHIVNIKTRVHNYEPESWRMSWNLPKSINYTDVKIDLVEVKLKEQNYGECTLTEFKGKDFQLRRDLERTILKKATCIEAVTQYSGDEFSIGQWIWDIKPCKNL